MEKIQFGNKSPIHTSEKAKLPLQWNNNNLMIPFIVVPGSCPPILGNPTLNKLEAVILTASPDQPVWATYLLNQNISLWPVQSYVEDKFIYLQALWNSCDEEQESYPNQLFSAELAKNRPSSQQVHSFKVCNTKNCVKLENTMTRQPTSFGGQTRRKTG